MYPSLKCYAKFLKSQFLNLTYFMRIYNYLKIKFFNLKISPKQIYSYAVLLIMVLEEALNCWV